MRQALLLAALLAAAFSTPAHADDHYLRAAAGRVQADTDAADRDRSWNLGVGWRFTRHLSVETGYNDLGSYAATTPGAGGPLDIQADSFELGLAGKFPLGRSGLFAQARLGAHRWERERHNVTIATAETGLDPYLGLGLGYDFNDLFGIQLGVERYRVDGVDYDRIMLGFELR